MGQYSGKGSSKHRELHVQRHGENLTQKLNAKCSQLSPHPGSRLLCADTSVTLLDLTPNSGIITLSPPATSCPCSGCLMRIYLQTCQGCFRPRAKLGFFSSLGLCPVLDGQRHWVLPGCTPPASTGFSPVLHCTSTEVSVFFQPPRLTSLLSMIQPGAPSHLSCIFRKWTPKIFIPYFTQEKRFMNSEIKKGPSFSLILLPAPSLPIPSLLLKYLMKYFAFFIL